MGGSLVAPVLTYALDEDRAEKAIIDSEAIMPDPSRSIDEPALISRSDEKTSGSNPSAQDSDIKKSTEASSSQRRSDEDEKQPISSHGSSLSMGWTKPRRKTSEEREAYRRIHGYDRLKHFKLEDNVAGIPRLAAFIDSDANFAICRRFGRVFSRILVNLQIEIATLEQQLNELDEKDEASTDCAFRLHTLYHEDGWDEGQRELLEELQIRLTVYADLVSKYNQMKALPDPSQKNFLSVYNYIWDEKPLEKGQEGFIFEADDFASLGNGKQNSQVDDILELCFNSWPNSIKKFIQGPKQVAKTNDQTINYYSQDRVGYISKLVIVILTVVILMAPVYLLVLVPMSKGAMSTTVLCFALIFSVAISLFTRARVETIFIGTSAYCAVLVSVLGSLTTPSPSHA